MTFQYCIVGGGIVGLATASDILARDRAARILVIEKEAGFGEHQTGHNSGVIHAGIYYAPGSLKAKLCREGAMATKAFARDNNIPFEVCGKLLVATSPVEMEHMEALKHRAVENGIGFEEVSAARLHEIEPNIAGLGALLVPSTGIINYKQICDALAEGLKANGAKLMTGTRVKGISEDGTGVVVTTDHGETIRAKQLVACAGLQSDRLARLAGLNPTHQIVPFRGEYYTLPDAKSTIVKHLIYPIPDPDLPFLGIHLTRMIDGRVTVGPNAVLGFHREGYPKGSFDLGDVTQMLTFGGFWKMARKNLASGIGEFRNSISRRGYLEQCRKYCPSLELSDLGQPDAGIRAQAVLADGTLVHDFLFLDSPRQLHVCNAPSPAATSAMPIAKMIVDRIEERSQ
ncbi:MAG: L-2-hydroxyglutarate oxidase [Mesorhizobium sp.]|uniref:L-2-hydroxyglutarate oxidase n=1 Tax=Mesorhizobium sp. TaxID=1871066 RepID=UPI000FE6E02B|nr:L-2-hydroxyglutarate oxidase [Mesorhizobium sp.]RWO30994.1 MAG: L-2-hydroxyglutarate oxidase [Mesorhizobium sp.]